MNSRLLVLAHVSGDPRRLIARAAQGSKPAQWAFFSPDYRQYLRWESALAPEFITVKINADLPQAVNSLTGPFLSLLTDLGRQYKSPAWWASRISERNPLVSPLFLYCGYQEIFRRRFTEASGTVCIVAADWALLDSLADLARESGFRVEWAARRSQAARQFAFYVKAIGRIIKFIFRGLAARLAGTDLSPSAVGALTLIHTYADEGCLRSDGVFVDRYFTGLREWLEEHKHNVAMIPDLSRLRLPVLSAWQWFRRSKQRFINPYVYYRWDDFCFAVRESCRRDWFPQPAMMLDGMDVTRLLRAEQDRHLGGNADALLYYRQKVERSRV